MSPDDGAEAGAEEEGWGHREHGPESSLCVPVSCCPRAFWTGAQLSLHLMSTKSTCVP